MAASDHGAALRGKGQASLTTRETGTALRFTCGDMVYTLTGAPNDTLIDAASRSSLISPAHWATRLNDHGVLDWDLGAVCGTPGRAEASHR
ncbi:MAG: hypothetical protein ACRD0U_18305, partial [Acidimicrobiales bacterium]